MYTKQEAFDIAFKGVYGQGGPSAIGHTCAYRSEEGLKCGIGHLIKDEDYNPKMDKLIKNQIQDIVYMMPSYITDLQTRFLIDLQSAHDNAHTEFSVFNKDFMEYFVAEMKDLAERYRLDTTVIHEIYQPAK